MNEKEVWVDIPEYEGLYQVSNTGKVRSILFRNNVCRKSRIKELKPTDNGNGYLIVNLKKDGKRKSAYVHRLVAEMFCERQSDATVVNHRDFNKYNNCADNLEWCSQKDNVKYSAHKMRHPKKRCRPTNTGEKYIRKIFSHGKKNLVRFKVSINHLGVSKEFRTLGEAIAFRNEVMQDGR